MEGDCILLPRTLPLLILEVAVSSATLRRYLPQVSHIEKLSTLKIHKLCNNCLGGGHFAHNCKSLHMCKKCQRAHHTLLHIENQPEPELQVSSNAAVRLTSSPLLMMCRVVVTAHNDSAIEARALLDNVSSASFITEHLAQTFKLPCTHQIVYV